MFSTLILGLLLAFLVVQIPIAVSALPTSGTTAITSARLETRQASDSDRNNNDGNHGNGYNVVPPDNAATSRFTPPLYKDVTSSTREFATQAVWSQLDKRDSSEDQKHNSSDMSPGEILGAVIAALGLLVAIIPLFRCLRFRRWVSSISPTVKKALGTKLLNPVSTTSRDPSGQDGGVQPVEESLAPRRPERVVTCPLP